MITDYKKRKKKNCIESDYKIKQVITNYKKRKQKKEKCIESDYKIKEVITDCSIIKKKKKNKTNKQKKNV